MEVLLILDSLNNKHFLRFIMTPAIGLYVSPFHTVPVNLIASVTYCTLQAPPTAAPPAV